MGWVGYAACIGERRGAYKVWGGNLRERNHIEDPGIDGRIILRWIFRRGMEGMYWIDLAQNRDKWQALVNT
jgi:hypothetical protein